MSDASGWAGAAQVYRPWATLASVITPSFGGAVWSGVQGLVVRIGKFSVTAVGRPPVHVTLFSVLVTDVLKVMLKATSTREEVANVISPTLSRPSANFATKFTAAAFSGAQAPLVASEPERSITIMMLTSRRVDFDEVCSVIC